MAQKLNVQPIAFEMNVCHCYRRNLFTSHERSLAIMICEMTVTVHV